MLWQTNQCSKSPINWFDPRYRRRCDRSRIFSNTEDLLCRVPTWELPFPDWDQDIAEKITQKIDQRMVGQNAPKRALEIAKFGSELPFEAAMRHERDAFLTLRTEPQARALRHMFFAERAAKLPTDIENQPADITKIGIVGGGTMGAGIAYACISAGYSVVLLEEDADGVERARQNVGRLIQAGVARGILDDAKKLALEASITYSDDYASTADIDLMIEAAFENMDVKKSIFAQLDAHVPDHAILATNTSYLDVNEIADSTKTPLGSSVYTSLRPPHHAIIGSRPRRCHIGSHLIYGLCDCEKTPQGTRSCWCLRWVHRQSHPCPLPRGSGYHFMDGSTPWDVDEAMVNFGYAMGPYEAQDLSGLDIAYANRRRQDATRDPNRRYIPISDRMVDEGRLGKKWAWVGTDTQAAKAALMTPD